MREKIVLILNAAISIILVAVILHFVGVEDVLHEIGSINLGFLALAFVMLFSADLVMSYRIHILLEGTGAKTNFLEILKSHFVGMLLADFTPSRTGYFATAAALKYNYNVPAPKALLSRATRSVKSTQISTISPAGIPKQGPGRDRAIFIGFPAGRPPIPRTLAPTGISNRHGIGVAVHPRGPPGTYPQKVPGAWTQKNTKKG